MSRPDRPPPRAARLRAAIPAAIALALAPPPAGAADPRICGTVVVPANVGVGLPSPANTMDPALYSSAEAEFELMQLMFRPLVRPDASLGIDHAAGLADAIDVSPDHTVFTVTLKPWTWSDSTPVTAADVLFDWNQIKALGARYALYGIGGVPELIRSVDAPDSRTVRFTLTRPVTPEWFELVGLTQFYALPSRDWGRHTLAEQQSLQSEASFYRLSDGPFLLDAFEVGRYAAFVPNPRYGGHHATIRRFVVDFLEGADPLEALRSGAVDMADLPFDVWTAAARLDDEQRVAMGPVQSVGTLIPNLASPSAPFFADVRVRQAIAIAIDQQRLIDTVFHGQGEIVHGFVPTALTGFLPPELRSGHSILDHDPARARALLDAAGYRAGPDGIRRKGTVPLAFTVLTTAGLPIGALLLQLVRDDLAQVGIRLDIHEVEFNQLIAAMLGPPAGWQATYLVYTTNTYPDGSQFFASNSSGNFEHYASPHMDALLAAATREPGRDALYAVERYALEQQPIIFLPNGNVTILARPGIGGIDRFVQANGNWNPEDLTLSKELACDATPPA